MRMISVAPFVVVTPDTAEVCVPAVESVALPLKAALTVLGVVVALAVAAELVQLWSTAVKVHE
jgi:hypothetical protein